MEKKWGTHVQQPEDAWKIGRKTLIWGVIGMVLFFVTEAFTNPMPNITRFTERCQKQCTCDCKPSIKKTNKEIKQ